jgi:hypothetical protein
MSTSADPNRAGVLRKTALCRDSIQIALRVLVLEAGPESKVVVWAGSSPTGLARDHER